MYASMLIVILDMQEKQFGHSTVTSAGTPPFICWEVCAGSLTDLTLLSSHLLHPCQRDCPLVEYKQRAVRTAVVQGALGPAPMR